MQIQIRLDHFTHPLIVLLCGQVNCEYEVKIVVGNIAALRGQDLKK